VAALAGRREPSKAPFVLAAQHRARIIAAELELLDDNVASASRAVDEHIDMLKTKLHEAGDSDIARDALESRRMHLHALISQSAAVKRVALEHEAVTLDALLCQCVEVVEAACSDCARPYNAA